jgi:NADH-quinone oxidoreductase subunit G
VTEAVLRYAVEKLRGVTLSAVDFLEVRGDELLREASFTIGDITIKLAVVHTLKKAAEVVDKIRRGECDYDLIEVMACPGGCIGGAGQPVSLDYATKHERCKGLYNADKMMQLHKSQDNHIVTQCYHDYLGEPGGPTAHHLLHTTYQNRRRIVGDPLVLLDNNTAQKVQVSVCVGTSCFVRGSQTLLKRLTDYIESRDLDDLVEVQATFCFEHCDRGPTVRVGELVLEHCTYDMAKNAIDQALEAFANSAASSSTDME